MSFPAYPEYKDSGVPWLGAVPVHWPVTRLKNSVADCRNGIWGDEQQGDENDIICVRVADFIRETALVDLTSPTYRNVREQDRASRIVRPGDLLLEKSGGGEKQLVGAVVQYTHAEPAICSNFVARIQLAPNMSSSFWAYVHSAAYAVRLNYRSVKQTSGIQNLDQTQYLDELAAFPPIEEENAIAAFLDRETAKIDALVAEQERLIALLKEKRQAVISHAVTKGLNPDAPMKDSGIEWLGEIPEHWEIRRIGQLSSKIGSGKTPSGGAEIYVEGGVLFLRSQNIYDEGLDLRETVRIPPEIDEEMRSTRVMAGDILLNITGASLGRTCIFKGACEPANVNQHVCIIRLKSLDNLPFVSLAMKSTQTKSQIDAAQNGAAREGLNFAQISRLVVAFPPSDEARAVADDVEKRAKTINDLIEEAQFAITLLQERRAALISAAVTGKIDVRGLVDTPATAELETA